MERVTSEVHQLRREVRQMMGNSPASLLDATTSTLVDFKRDNGRSEPGSAEGSDAVGESPAGAGRTAVGQRPAGAGPTAVREMILRDGGLRNFREMGRGEAARWIQRGVSQTRQGGLE